MNHFCISTDDGLCHLAVHSLQCDIWFNAAEINTTTLYKTIYVNVEKYKKLDNHCSLQVLVEGIIFYGKKFDMSWIKSRRVSSNTSTFDRHAATIKSYEAKTVMFMKGPGFEVVFEAIKVAHHPRLNKCSGRK